MLRHIHIVQIQIAGYRDPWIAGLLVLGSHVSDSQLLRVPPENEARMPGGGAPWRALPPPFGHNLAPISAAISFQDPPGMLIFISKNMRVSLWEISNHFLGDYWNYHCAPGLFCRSAGFETSRICVFIGSGSGAGDP